MTRSLTLFAALTIGLAVAPPAAAQLVIRAPFVRVETGAGGTYVRAPFVRIYSGGPPPVFYGPPVYALPPGYVPYPPGQMIVPGPGMLPPSRGPVVPQPPSVQPPEPLPAAAETPPGNPDLFPPPPTKGAEVPTLEQFSKSFQPRPGNYEVTLLNPVSKQPTTVRFSLPAGTPQRVQVRRNQLEYQYAGRQFVRIEFDEDGATVISR